MALFALDFTPLQWASDNCRLSLYVPASCFIALDPLSRITITRRLRGGKDGPDEDQFAHGAGGASADR